MPQFQVNALKANLGAFSRAYLFNIQFVSAPVGVTGGENIAVYLARATSLPESTIDPIEVPWQGQVYKIGSTHTFAEWSCTFNLDSKGELRRRMVLWSNLVHNPETNIQGTPDAYYGEIMIELLDVAGNPVMKYILHQAWPSSIAALDLAQDSKEVSQFDVTFIYNWFTVV